MTDKIRNNVLQVLQHLEDMATVSNGLTDEAWRSLIYDLVDHDLAMRFFEVSEIIIATGDHALPSDGKKIMLMLAFAVANNDLNKG